MVHRATSPTPLLRDNKATAVHPKPDAVAILALLNGGKGEAPQTVLVRQFRPPVDAYTIELPAGLVDPHETPSEAAIRELKEETGYSGVVRSSSVASCLSPGLTSETVSIVIVDVDLQLEHNRRPVAQPEEGEFVQRLVVPVSKLMAELDKHEKTGDIVFAAVRTLALGYQMQLHSSL